MGRPSKYKPSFCNTILELKKEGASDTEICAALEISRDTFYRWKKTNVEFLKTCQLADVHAQAWWEKLVRINLTNKHFKAGMWFRQVKNRFPKDYRH